MLFTHFYLTQRQKLETWVIISSASRENVGIEPTNWQKEIDKTSIHWYNKLLNMLLNRCSYKNSCLNELVYNPSVLVLMICSFKNVLKGLALDFFVWRACCYLLHSLSIEICNN